jgi:UDP-N-acetyl-D-galactosamine dehydrogenase
MNKSIAIIGLGDVGLPLAVEFGKQRPVIGFDINETRVKELGCGRDHIAKSDVLDRLALSEGNYFVVSARREENIDSDSSPQPAERSGTMGA